MATMLAMYPAPLDIPLPVSVMFDGSALWSRSCFDCDFWSLFPFSGSVLRSRFPLQTSIFGSVIMFSFSFMIPSGPSRVPLSGTIILVLIWTTTRLCCHFYRVTMDYQHARTSSGAMFLPTLHLPRYERIATTILQNVRTRTIDISARE